LDAYFPASTVKGVCITTPAGNLLPSTRELFGTQLGQRQVPLEIKAARLQMAVLAFFDQVHEAVGRVAPNEGTATPCAALWASVDSLAATALDKDVSETQAVCCSILATSLRTLFHPTWLVHMSLPVQDKLLITKFDRWTACLTSADQADQEVLVSPLWIVMTTTPP
jgi:hypothetical protein